MLPHEVFLPQQCCRSVSLPLTPVVIPGDEEGLSDALTHNGQLAEYAALRILLPCGSHAFWIGVVTQEHDQGSLRRLLHPPPKAKKYRFLGRRLSGIADQQNSERKLTLELSARRGNSRAKIGRGVAARDGEHERGDREPGNGGRH